MRNTPTRFDAIAFFRNLTETNKLARRKGFRFCEISGLQGLEDAIAAMQSTKAFVCVGNADNGYFELDNTPHKTDNKMIVLAMRHKLDSMSARADCIDILNELFRQFCSVLIQQDQQLRNNMQYLVPRIRLQTTNRYLTPGVVCLIGEMSIVTYVDTCFNQDEWGPDSGSGSGSGDDNTQE